MELKARIIKTTKRIRTKSNKTLPLLSHILSCFDDEVESNL